MIDLKAKKPSDTFHHTETGTHFKVKPLSPKRSQWIRDKCMKGDKLDTVRFYGMVVDEVVEEWGGIVQEPTKENKLALGEDYAYTIAPGIYDFALELFGKLQEATADAKND